MRRKRNKKVIVVLLVFIIALGGGGYVLTQFSDEEKDYSSEDSEASGDEDTPSLKDIANQIDVQGEPFYIGATDGAAWIDEEYGNEYEYGNIIAREFNYSTPDSAFKHWRIRVNKEEWDFSRGDKWIEFAEKHNLKLRMHSPISQQRADWLANDSLTPQEIENELKSFVRKVAQRYDGEPTIWAMNVVNETVANGDWYDNPVSVPYIKLGYDDDANTTPLYIKMAFEQANTYAPNTYLIYNQHEHPENTESWDLIKETILYLREEGLRVDGIGWQAHVPTGWDTEENLAHLRELIDWAHANNLGFHVTEASSWIYAENPTEENFNAQGRTYAAILEALLEKKDSGLVTWNTWHVSDKRTWRAQYHPSIYDDEFSPKPAYYAIMDTLKKYVDSPTCASNCFNKECGDDGCGGSCGICTVNKSCVSGKCISVESVDVDFDGNGKLDGKDYGIILGDWADYYDNNKLNNRSDLNGNGKIDGPDYTLFLQGWSDYFDK